MDGDKSRPQNGAHVSLLSLAEGTVPGVRIDRWSLRNEPVQRVNATGRLIYLADRCCEVLAASTVNEL
ncbi:hypothetical protein CEXT_262641 [Caerostris extrusa]|uniref:Uncharacterized protein n=1 Tax=Caerostris extrusa TaxID=172846 RepID=A0AAV4R3N0_CAEEX|nr:hypothetical protein CEXT_262641 [Caerostris extrusa]